MAEPKLHPGTVAALERLQAAIDANGDELARLREENARLREERCRHGWRGSFVSEQIEERCPVCGGQIFIGCGGYLTCSVIGCKQPSVGLAIEQLSATIATQAAEIERLKVFEDLIEQDRSAMEMTEGMLDAARATLKDMRETLVGIARRHVSLCQSPTCDAPSCVAARWLARHPAPASEDK